MFTDLLSTVATRLYLATKREDGQTFVEYTLIAAIVGAFLGTWVSSMVGLQVPNSHLKGFDGDLQQGKVLLMLDVPAGRYEQVRSIIAKTHPEAIDRGSEPTVPAFP